MYVSPLNGYVEALSPFVVVFEDGAFWKLGLDQVMKVGTYFGIVVLIRRGRDQGI